MEGERVPRPFLQTKSNERRAAFSPDGRWIAYESDESGQYEIYVRPLASSGGGKRPVSTGGGILPTWHRNGRELFYRNGSKVMVVAINTDGEPTLGKPRLLFESLSDRYVEYDVTPDGEHFVMIDESRSEPPPSELILVLNWFEELKRLVPTDN